MTQFDPDDHRTKCHLRWTTQLNRDQNSPGYPDKWMEEQCLFCRYYMPLAGPMGHDFGVCSNPAEPFDGRVRFEHDGCDGFVPADEYP